MFFAPDSATDAPSTSKEPGNVGVHVGAATMIKRGRGRPRKADTVATLLAKVRRNCLVYEHLLPR